MFVSYVCYSVFESNARSGEFKHGSNTAFNQRNLFFTKQKRYSESIKVYFTDFIFSNFFLSEQNAFSVYLFKDMQYLCSLFLRLFRRNITPCFYQMWLFLSQVYLKSSIAFAHMQTFTCPHADLGITCSYHLRFYFTNQTWIL